jgi:predicted transcriptional regulator of viral defense system
MDKDLYSRLVTELSQVGSVPGVRMSDVLELPDTLVHFINWIVRNQTVDISEVASYLRRDRSATRSLLETMVKKGYLELIDAGGEKRYRVHTTSLFARRVPRDV